MYIFLLVLFSLYCVKKPRRPYGRLHFLPCIWKKEPRIKTQFINVLIPKTYCIAKGHGLTKHSSNINMAWGPVQKSKSNILKLGKNPVFSSKTCAYFWFWKWGSAWWYLGFGWIALRASRTSYPAIVWYSVVSIIGVWIPISWLIVWSNSRLKSYR